MRKLDLDGKDYSLGLEIIESMGIYNLDTEITEAFINENGTIYVNVDTKINSQIRKYVYIFVKNEYGKLKLSSSNMDKTFTPVANSQLIGLLESKSGAFDCYQIITDIDSKLCISNKAKQIKFKNNNYLIIPITYQTSSFDIFLNLNNGQVVGVINYISNTSIPYVPESEFSLAHYERDFVEVAKQISVETGGNNINKQAELLEEILKLALRYKETSEGKQ